MTCNFIALQSSEDVGSALLEFGDEKFIYNQDKMYS